MKIAQIVSTFPPYRAGMGNVAFNISWQLSSLGHQVSVFTPVKVKGNVDTIYPFQIHRLKPWLRYGNAGFVPQLLWQLKGFDIIHLHYPFFGGAEMIYFLDKIKDINLVIHYHMDVFGEGLMKKFFSWHSYTIMPRILNQADKIIITSWDYAWRSRLRDRIKEDKDKFIEIPIGVNAQVFKPRRKDPGLLKKLDLENKKIILFIGALDKAHYFKGVTFLIKAFQMISSNDDYRLLIVGTGDLQNGYKTLAAGFGLEKKVIFAGFVPDDLLPLYYNLGDVFVLPSIDGSEAFGVVILEAMSSGMPIVASDLPGVRTLVEKKFNGLLVRPKDIATIARHLDWLLKNPQISAQYGRAGRQKVEEKYEWPMIGKQVEQVYKDILL